MVSLLNTVIGSRTEGNASSTNGTNASTDSGNDDDSDSFTKTILFLFLTFAIGATVRYLLKRTPLPYTVVLILVGLIVGAASKWQPLSFMQDYLEISHLDPHLMLLIFLPILIFESAFVMDVHIFKRTIGQVLLLAGPGLLISAFLTSLMARYIFPYNWSWVVALLFGTLLSATDPVAVVALLKELGAPKQLGTIIEGESLLNDGAAIVIFNVLLDELIPGKSRNGLQIFLYFLQVALGGPAFGYVMAKATIFCLSHVFNDALVEITITLASTYITFYIGEELLGVSGVLAVVTLGIEINSHRSNISPEVEVFLHRFWEVLGYLANTLIFVIVGVVISQRAFEGAVELREWMFLVTLYLTIIVIRLVVTGALLPILTRIGYSINWRHCIVISWGGLRGAVGLALALVVAQTSSIDFNQIGSKVLFLTAGIVILTLVINGTSTKYLLKGLGISDVSFANRKTMATAVARLNETKKRTINTLKSDRFLADASWDVVEKSTKIVDPYKHLDKNNEIANSKPVTPCQCAQCMSGVPHALTRRELAELAEEMRLRLIKAEKTSYWRQFEEGMLGKNAVRILSNLADAVMDTPNRLVTMQDLAPNWQIPIIFDLIERFFEWLIVWMFSSKYQPPTSRFLNVFYRIAVNIVFEWFIYGVIVINCVCTVVEIIITDNTGILVLRILDYIACGVYVVEAVVKIIGLRQYYWLCKWNLFDIFILVICLIEIPIEIALPTNSFNFSPALLRLVRILRLGRLAKLMLPQMIKLIDYFVNNRLRLGYDIGRGFVVAEEDMLRRFDRIMQVNQEIAKELKERLAHNHQEVIRSLGQIRKEHPGIALSVKTEHATRSVLNNCQDYIRQLLSGGLLDETAADKLLQLVEMKIKCLENGKSSLIPPNLDNMFLNLPWLQGLDTTAIDSLRNNAEMRQFDNGEFIVRDGEQANGIYIVMSGLVRVLKPCSLTGQPTCNISREETEEEEEQMAIPMERHYANVDFYGAGTVLGETATLLNVTKNALVECETDVQAFYVPKDKLNETITSYPELEERLWRICGKKVAVNILQKLAKYQDWPICKLSLMCESSFIVSAHQEPFQVKDEHLEVVLVSGEACCAITREIFFAPCVIPKNIKDIQIKPGNSRLLVITTDFSSTVPSSTDDEHSEQNKWIALVQSYVSTMVASLKEKATLSWLKNKANSLDNWWRRKIERRQAPIGQANGPRTAFEAPATNANTALPSYQHTSQLVNRPALARDTEPDIR